MIDFENENAEQEKQRKEIEAEEDKKFQIKEIRRMFALGEIDSKKALSLARFRNYIIQRRLHPSPRCVVVEGGEVQLELLDIERFFKELEEGGMDIQPSHNTSPVVPLPQSIPNNDQSFVPIRWKGTKADLGRVYEILRSLIDCSGTDWERHFIGLEGQTMKGATDTHNAAASSKRPEINALTTAARGMKTEPD